MPNELLRITRNRNYVIFALNRPEKRNSLNAAMIEAFDRGLGEVETDREVRALLIRGEGRGFCSGIDLAEAAGMERGNDPSPLEHLFRRLEQLPIPTVAAIRGAAIAGGLQLALHCDLRIASDDLRMGMTLGKIGLTVPFDFARKLIETVGAPNTNYILLTSDLLDAQRAVAMGLVHEVVSNEDLDPAAIAMVEKLAGNAPLSMRSLKLIVRRCVRDAFDAEHGDLEEFSAKVRNSADFREGARAFVEKRKPVWRGE
ncbi:MAG: enoyl-CoA hydratase/isomerase family protein [Candidatus Binataceae bacterium]|nr:enoyl-CoA hydratase/isomerase family protein [Candidatus Binataceae bacterium]